MHILYYSWQEKYDVRFFILHAGAGTSGLPCMHELSLLLFRRRPSPTSGPAQAQTYDAVFTFNFFPLISDMAESFTYHISAGFLTVLTIRFILTVCATPVTIFSV